MVKVMLGMAMFPVVWRSDNAKEFVAEVVAEMNKMLEIKLVMSLVLHITRSPRVWLSPCIKR